MLKRIALSALGIFLASGLVWAVCTTTLDCTDADWERPGTGPGQFWKFVDVTAATSTGITTVKLTSPTPACSGRLEVNETLTVTIPYASSIGSLMDWEDSGWCEGSGKLAMSVTTAVKCSQCDSANNDARFKLEKAEVYFEDLNGGGENDQWVELDIGNPANVTTDYDRDDSTCLVEQEGPSPADLFEVYEPIGGWILDDPSPPFYTWDNDWQITQVRYTFSTYYHVASGDYNIHVSWIALMGLSEMTFCSGY